MACLNSRRNNCFGPSTPCPVVCCSCTDCCENNVQNPPVITSTIAFFSLTTPTAILSVGVVPVTLVLNSGNGVTSPSVGTASLTAGTYEVSYNVTSIIGEDGINSFGLVLGGSVIPSSVASVDGATGDLATISNSVVFSTTGTQSLTLNNLGDDTITVNVANLTIRKIS